MERKAKVTQDAVNATCDDLMKSGKNVTVNAIIAMTGGSFSTITPNGQALEGRTGRKYRASD